MVGKHFLQLRRQSLLESGPQEESAPVGAMSRNLGSSWAPFLGALTLSHGFSSQLLANTAQTSRAVHSTSLQTQKSALAIS